jgi:DNA repair exonuclease SbcCD ATPase subunit
MLIKTLELKNFCQHRALSLEFKSGLTAIIGPNGCGKSNVLTALRYAFTGDIVTAGNKSHNICQFASKSSKSFVRVVFSHGDVEAEIVRYLRPANAKDVLTYADGVTIHGAIKINAALDDLLGDAYNLLSDIGSIPYTECLSSVE